MKQIHRTFRAWLVCLLAMLAALPAGADVTIDQLVFTEVEGGYSVTKNSDATLEGTLVIPDTYEGRPVVEIGERAFFDCTSLTSVTIGSGVTSIGENAFFCCTGLTSVTIPDGVTTIGRYAFDYCTGLTSVTIGSGVTSIGEGAFLQCTGLTSVTIPDGVTSIGKGVFQGCTGLTSVTIPNSVTSIGDFAFLFCSSLTSVTIPDGVTSIGVEAFGDCRSLKKITCRATTPPALEYSFMSNHYDNATLYVSEESVDAYRQHEEWGQFKNIVGKDLTGIGATEADAEGTGAAEIYDLGGVRHPEGLGSLRPGNYVVRQGGKSRKIHVR